MINYRSEGSRRLLSDVTANVPAKFSKTNSFWYNPDIFFDMDIYYPDIFLDGGILDWMVGGVNIKTAIYG